MYLILYGIVYQMKNSHDIVEENSAINSVCGADIVFFRNNLHIETIEKIKTDLESADRWETGTILISKQENKVIALDDYIDNILANIWFEWCNHSTFIELLCDLLDNWSSNYSLYDLFFNNANFNVRSKDKKDLCEKINIILEFNVFEYKEKYNKVYEKIDEILENENKNNISSMQLLISTKKQATQDYNELNDDYSWLRRKTMVDGILHKIESSMKDSMIQDLTQQINKSKETLTPKEKEETIRKIFNNEEISDLRFLYCGEGWEWYSDFETEDEDNEYEFTKIWLNLIEENKEILTNYVKGKLFDFWCWNWRKWKILMDAHKRIFWVNEDRYIAMDISSNILESTRENFTEKESPEWILIFDVDWKRESVTKYINWKNTYLFVWWTIWNFSDNQIINKLQKTFWNDSLHPTTWNYLIFDYFTPPKNEEELKNIIKSYAWPDGKQWLINWLKQLWIPENIIENFTHVVRYVSEDWSLCAECIDLWNVEIFWDIKSKSNMPWKILEWFMFMADKDFSLNKLSDWTKINPPIKIEKWKFYPLNISRRFTEKEIDELLKQAWYTRINVKKLKQWDWMSIAVARKPGEKLQRNKMFFKSLIWASLLLALWTWSNQLLNNQKDQNKKSQIENFVKEKDITFGTSSHPSDLDVAYDETEGYYEPIKSEMISMLWDIINQKNMSKGEINEVELRFVNYFKNKMKDISKQDREKWQKEYKNITGDYTLSSDYLATPYDFYKSCEKKDMINLIYKFIDENLDFLKWRNCWLLNWEFASNTLDNDDFVWDDIDEISENINSLNYNIQIRITWKDDIIRWQSMLQDQNFEPINLKQWDQVLKKRISYDKKFCYETESGDKYLVMFVKLSNDSWEEKQIMLASPIKDKNILDILKENITKQSNKSFHRPRTYMFSTDKAKIVLDDFLKYKKKIEDRPDLFPNIYGNYLKSIKTQFDWIEHWILRYDSDMRNISLFWKVHKTLSYDFVKSKENELVDILNKLQKDYEEIENKEYKIYNNQQQKYVSWEIAYLKEEMQEIMKMCTILQYYVRLEAEKLWLKLDKNDHDYYENKIKELWFEFGPVEESVADDWWYYKSIKD